MPQTENNIIFPQNADATLTEILASYGVGENKKQQFEIIKSGKSPIATLVASLAIKRIKNEMTPGDFVQELKKIPKLNTKTAPLVAKDIENKIISLIKIEKEAPIKKALPEKAKPFVNNKTLDKDNYREPLE